jgi:translocation and assembly module TamB
VRYFRVFLASIVALLLALGLGLAWLAGTESGLRFLVARSLPFLPLDAQPQSVHGRLVGPLAIDRLVVDAPGVSGTIERIELDWRPTALFRRVLHLRLVRIVAPQLQLSPAAPDAEPDSGKPAAFPLPLNLVVDDLKLQDGQFRRGHALIASELQLAFAGRLTGNRLELLRLQLESEQGALRGHARASLEPADRWDVDLEWRLQSGPESIAGHTRLLGQLPDLTVEQTLSAPFVARIEGSLRGLPQAPAWSLAAVIEALPESTSLWPETFDGASANLRIEGRLDQSQVTGRLEFPGIMAGPMDLEAEAGWAEGIATVSHLGLELANGSRIVASGRIEPRDELKAEFRLEGRQLGWPLEADTEARQVSLPQLSLQGQGAGGRWQLDAAGRVEREGLPATDFEAALRLVDTLLTLEQLELTSPGGEIHATAAGELDAGADPIRYRLEADADLRLPQQPPVVAQLHIAGDTLGAEVQSLAARLLGGRVDGTGRIAWAGEEAADFSLSFVDIDPAALAAEWPGRLGGQLEITGLPGSATGLEVELESLAGELRGLPLEGRATLNLAGSELLLRRADLSFGTSSLQASGRLGEEQLEMDAELVAVSLAELAPGARGGLSATAHVTGTRRAPHVVLQASGAGLRWQAWRARALELEADVDLGGRQASRLSLSLEGFAAGPGPGGQLRLDADGTPESHRLRLAASRPRPEQAFDLAIEGRWTEPDWNGRLTELRILEEGEPVWALQGQAELHAGPQLLRLADACMDGTLGRLCLEGSWDRSGPWRGRALLASLDLAPLSEWAGDGLLARGVLSGQIVVSADDTGFRSLDGGLGLTAGDIRLAGEDETTLLAWTGGSAAFDGDEREARTSLKLEFAGEDLVEGRIGVGWNAPDPPLEGEFEAVLGSLDIIAEMLPELAQLEGRALLAASLSGSLGEPLVNGRFEWLGGSAEIPALGIHPREIEVRATLERGALRFDATGQSGEGSFSADGSFDLAAETMQGHATLRGDKLLLVDLPEARVAANPNLELNYADRAIKISGEVTIPKARITGVGGPGAVTASPDEVIVGPRAREEAEDLSLSSRVRVEVGPDVQVQAKGLRGRIEGNLLTVAQPRALPWGRGELRVVNGTFSAFGQRLVIETGRLLYTGGPLENPGLDIRAIRRVDEITAGALVRGTLNQPEISVYSEPPMPRAEALSYLTLGKSLDQLQAGEQTTVNQAANSLAMSGGGLIARDLGRRLGLDEVSVAADDTGGTSVVISKYLGAGIYLSYGLGLFDTVNTLRLRYQINRRLSIEATSGIESAADLFYTFERD